jgi:hypothetical protein
MPCYTNPSDEKPVNKHLTVRIANNYGGRVVYPVCETSQLLAQLAGTRTLTAQAIEIIQALGFTLSVQPETLP